MECFWINSERNQKVLTVQNFIFRIKKKHNQRRYYWCCLNCDCSVKAVTLDGALISIRGEHSHPNDLDKIINFKMKELIKEIIAKDAYRSPHDIYDEAKLVLSTQYNTNITRYIPSFIGLKSYMYRCRKVVAPHDLVINQDSLRDYSFILENGRNMLLHAEFSDEKMIILGDSEFVNKFSNMSNFSIIMDGTFKTPFTSFYQMYIVHGSFNDQSFPLLYCFIDGKTENIYTRMLNCVKEKLLEKNVKFSPQRIEIDFESAVCNAIRNVFPTVQISGSYFHFGQAIWRKLQRLELTRLFDTDENFKNCIHLTSALPLIPVEDIDKAWAFILTQWPTTNSNIIKLKEYIEEMWLMNTNSTVFNRQMWNQYGLLNIRTNNVAEGFYLKLKKQLNKTSASFWEVIPIIKKMQVYTDTEIQRLMNGGKPKPRKQIFVLQEEKISILWSRYGRKQINLFTLLEELRNLFKLNVLDNFFFIK